MAVSENTSGSQTATLTTEHSLATITTAGVYQLRVDLANLADGETLRLRAKTKVRSSSSGKLEWEAYFAHTQNEANAVSPPIVSVHSVEFTLTQTGGTGRAFEWSVVQT